MDDALLHLRECEECLSTPSLGITKMTVSATDAVKLAFFQLPLSGSPLVLTLLEHILREVFQLPLSGSRSMGHAPEFKNSAVLSTPSLGITYFLIDGCTVDSVEYLSTPSLGITYLTSIFIDGHPKYLGFQLPLSGSPSPIPGFFGSPRLSAAAPLRTNDF